MELRYLGYQQTLTTTYSTFSRLQGSRELRLFQPFQVWLRLLQDEAAKGLPQHGEVAGVARTALRADVQAAGTADIELHTATSVHATMNGINNRYPNKMRNGSALPTFVVGSVLYFGKAFKIIIKE